jgi:hypothetical protein
MPAARAWAQLNILSEVAYARLRDEGMTAAGGEPKKLIGEFRAAQGCRTGLLARASLDARGTPNVGEPRQVL